MENTTSTAQASQPGTSLPSTITISPSQRLEQLPVAALLAFVPRLRTTYRVMGRRKAHLKVATSRTHYRLKLGTGAILHVSDNIVDLVRLIDGRRTIQALSDALAEQQGRPVHPAEIVYLLRHRLAPGGLVELSFPLALPAPKQGKLPAIPARSLMPTQGASATLEPRTAGAIDAALPSQRHTISRPLDPAADVQWIPPGRRAERLRATRPLPTRRKQRRRSSYPTLVATLLIVLAAGAVFAFAHAGFSHASFTPPSLASFFGGLTPPALNNKPPHLATPTPTPPPLPIHYIVQDDDTLPQIAARFHVTVGALLLVNHLSTPNAIKSGQVLTIPSVYRPHTNPAGYAHPIFYIIQPGDNLYSIAQLFNTTPAALSQYNHIRNQALIKIGDALVIP